MTPPECLRCGEPVPWMGMYVFIREGLEFRRLADVFMCLNCGHREGNVISQEEADAL
jgi:hypothetical protein